MNQEGIFKIWSLDLVAAVDNVERVWTRRLFDWIASAPNQQPSFFINGQAEASALEPLHRSKANDDYCEFNITKHSG